jgi:hypothetical protein
MELVEILVAAWFVMAFAQTAEEMREWRRKANYWRSIRSTPLIPLSDSGEATANRH